jgi:hypothetical protein
MLSMDGTLDRLLTLIPDENHHADRLLGRPDFGW